MKIAPAISHRKRNFSVSRCVEDEIEQSIAKRVQILHQYVDNQSHIVISPKSFAVLESIKILLDEFRVVRQSPTPVLSRDAWMSIASYADEKTVCKMRLVSKACARYFAPFVRSLCTPYNAELTEAQACTMQNILTVFAGADTLKIDLRRLYDDTNNDKMYLSCGIKSLSCLFEQGRPGVLFIINGYLGGCLPNTRFDLHGADIKNGEKVYPVDYDNVHCVVRNDPALHVLSKNIPYAVISFGCCLSNLNSKSACKAMYIYDTGEAVHVPFAPGCFPAEVNVYFDERMSQRMSVGIDNIPFYFSNIPVENLHFWNGQLPDFVPKNFKK